MQTHIHIHLVQFAYSSWQTIFRSHLNFNNNNENKKLSIAMQNALHFYVYVYVIVSVCSVFSVRSSLSSSSSLQLFFCSFHSFNSNSFPLQRLLRMHTQLTFPCTNNKQTTGFPCERYPNPFWWHYYIAKQQRGRDREREK